MGKNTHMSIFFVVMRGKSSTSFLQKIHKQENVHPADMHDEAGIVQLGVYYMFFVSWIFDECITNKSPFFSIAR